MNFLNPKLRFLFVTHLIFIAAFTVLFLSLTITPVNAATEWHIKDDATGGDCSFIGTWDTASKTCTLSQDLNQGIIIDSSNIILDGDGRTITGSNTGNGVYLYGRAGVTIKNLNVLRFSSGIYLYQSSGNTLTGNAVSNNYYGVGIRLLVSNNNTLTGNAVSNNYYGILLLGYNNTLTSNIVRENLINDIFVEAYSDSDCNNSITNTTGSGGRPIKYFNSAVSLNNETLSELILCNADGSSINNITIDSSTLSLIRTDFSTIANVNSSTNSYYGILLSSSNNNTLTGNTTSNNYWTGIVLNGSSGNTLTGNTASNNYNGILLNGSNNQIYKNNFISNSTQARVVSGSNVFNFASPIGGNYWSNFDTPAKGCNNVNDDDFCDEPHIFTGGQDNLPWTKKDGWLAPQNHQPTAFWAAIENAPKGSLKLRSSTATTDDSNVLKELPNGWALYVKDTHQDTQEADGYIWYEVEDKTNKPLGIPTWMKAKKKNADGSITGYLKYDASEQLTFQDKANILADISRLSLAGVVGNAIDHYYQAADINKTLEGGGYGGGSLSFLRTHTTPFPEQLIAAMVLQESGGIDFDNEWVAGDFGFGVMQNNTYGDTRGQIGEASLIRISSCEGYAGRANCFKPVLNNEGKAVRQLYKLTIPYRYYANSKQSIFSNVKDGLAKLYTLYKESVDPKRIPDDHIPWTVKDSDGITHTVSVSEMRILRTVRGYNGFGFKGTDLNGDGDYDEPGEADYCYRFEKPDGNTYLSDVAGQLSSVSSNFTGMTDAPSGLGAKLKAVELHQTEISLCSPGVLRIIDGSGNVTGQDQTNIPTTLYGDSGKAAVVYLPDDSYKYQVIGTGAGAYSLYIDTTTPTGITTVQVHDIPLSIGEVYTYQIDSAALARGERGVTIQIDTNGDGVNEKTIKTGSELSVDEFRLLTETVVDIDPDTINRKNANGVMTAYIEFPLGFDVRAVDASSVTLNGKPANAKPVAIGDFDNDGIPDLMVKFDRGIIISTIPFRDTQVTVTITGNILHNGKVFLFSGEDKVKVVH